MKVRSRSVDSTIVNWRERRESGRVEAGDDGFTLLEVVVSLVVFAILASAAMAMLLTAIKVGSQNRSRVVAAQLAAEQIEVVRGMRTQDIVIGTTTLPDVTTSGNTYHLVQQATYANSSGTGTACSSATGAQLGYTEVSVTVTWNNMGGVAPVRSDTLKALSIGGADPTKGQLVVSVVNGQNSPVSGQVVSLSPSGGTQTTGSDGCAIFTGLAPGSNYSASLNTSGYVDTLGVQNSTQGSQTVNGGALTKVQFSYDQAAALAITWVAPAGGLTPAVFSSLTPVTLVNTAYPNGYKGFLDCTDPNKVTGYCATGAGTSASPRSIPGLFPSSSGYSIYAGTCLDAVPTSGGPAATAVTAGQTTAANVTMGEVNVFAYKTVSGVSTPQNAVTIYAVHAADAGCPSGQILNLGSTANTGKLNALLPYGKWTISSSQTVITGSKVASVTPTISVPNTTANLNLT